jgi:hypothetical protein
MHRKKVEASTKNVAEPKHFSTTISQIHIAAHNFVSKTVLINNSNPERMINM